MEEVWKPIARFNGDYEVSNLGRVRSRKKYRGSTCRIMPQNILHHGYHAVTFWMNNKAIGVKVHRLVAETFIPNPYGLPVINHIDGNKNNNQVSNLEWVTHSANVQHSYDHGLKHGHRWTDKERQEISERTKAYYRRKKQKQTITSKHERL